MFFQVFDRLHPRYHFPHIALLIMGTITAIGSFFDLTTVINMLLASSVLVQSVAQVIALTVLRRQPDLLRPYREWLYPIPSIVALAGWLYVYFSAGWLSIGLSLAWIAAGVIAFLIWARIEHFWPFGAKAIREEYREQASLIEDKKDSLIKTSGIKLMRVHPFPSLF